MILYLLHLLICGIYSLFLFRKFHLSGLNHIENTQDPRWYPEKALSRIYFPRLLKYCRLVGEQCKKLRSEQNVRHFEGYNLKMNFVYWLEKHFFQSTVIEQTTDRYLNFRWWFSSKGHIYALLSQGGGGSGVCACVRVCVCVCVWGGGVNPYRAATGIFREIWVNTMAADVLPPCVARTSATMVLTLQDTRILVFHEHGFQIHKYMRCLSFAKF